MKVLQLCHRVPFPPSDGGNIAMYNLCQSLIENGNEVKILTLNTKKHFTSLDSLPAEFSKLTRAEAVEADTSVKPVSAFLNLFSKQSYNISRFYQEQFRARLEELLKAERFDIVQMESLFMMPYISTVRKYSSAKTVLRAHNVEHVIWEQLYQAEKNIFRKRYLKLLAARLKNFEINHLNEVDALLPITTEDEHAFRQLGCKVPMHVTPVGINPEKYSSLTKENSEVSLFHLGSMNWLPNIEAVNWFLENCWEKIHEAFPAVKLYLAGRAFPKQIMEAGYPGVHCEGEISDSIGYMSDKKIMIVPLLSGSGMRVKIIEGMALGKTIISTSIGAEGIQYTNEKNIMIADTPEQFFQAAKNCVNDSSFCDSIGKAATELVTKYYSNKVIGKGVAEFYEKLVSGAMS